MGRQPPSRDDTALVWLRSRLRQKYKPNLKHRAVANLRTTEIVETFEGEEYTIGYIVSPSKAKTYIKFLRQPAP